jgi:hypothetical protein
MGVLFWVVVGVCCLGALIAYRRERQEMAKRQEMAVQAGLKDLADHSKQQVLQRNEAAEEKKRLSGLATRLSGFHVPTKKKWAQGRKGKSKRDAEARWKGALPPI